MVDDSRMVGIVTRSDLPDALAQLADEATDRRVQWQAACER